MASASSKAQRDTKGEHNTGESWWGVVSPSSLITMGLTHLIGDGEIWVELHSREPTQVFDTSVSASCRHKGNLFIHSLFILLTFFFAGGC